MDKILGEIYCLFESLFGENFGDYLWGWNCNDGTFTNPNKFNQIGLICLAISLVAVIIYYYVFNPVRRQRLWWFVTMATTILINGFVGCYITINDYRDGKIGDCLLHTRDEEGNIIATLITEWDCVYFGITNLIVSAIFFFLFSMILKWGSNGNKHYPF